VVDEVFRDTQVYDYAFAQEPGGRSFLALQRQIDGKGRDVETDLVRFTLDDGGRLGRSVVLALDDLRERALWDAGVDLDGVDIAGLGLSVAPGGDAFLSLVAHRDGTSASGTLLRVAADGSAQKVLAAGELSTAGIFPDGATYPRVKVAAPADDRLWGQAGAYVPRLQGDVVRLVQIVDPTMDGDWSDREVRPLVLPASIPQVQDGVWDWQFGDFGSTAPAPGTTAAGSVLLPVMGRGGDLRVYRLTDTEDDGILAGEGEAELVFQQSTDLGSAWMSPPTIAAGPRQGSPELALLGLTEHSRVSTVVERAAQDVVRGLYNPSAILVHPDGSLYVGVQAERVSPKEWPYSVLHVTSAATGSTSAVEPVDPVATLAPPGINVVPRHRLTPGVPLLKTLLWPGSHEMLLFYGADGSGPADVVPGIQTRSSGCPSLDGTAVVIDAEIDVPNEDSLYLVDTTSDAAPRLLSERSWTVLCPFDEDAIAVIETDAVPWSAARMDPHTGSTTLLDNAIPPGLYPSLSPDGRLLAMASGEDGRMLRLADLTDGSVRVLAEDLPATAVGMRWSPDASRLAITTTDWDPLQSLQGQAGPHVVWVIDVEGDGPPERVFSLQASPDVAWSADGRQLAIRANSTSGACCCTQGELTILDLETGATRVVAPDASFVAWSPVDPTVLAWGSPARLVVEEDGVPREIVAPRVRSKDGRAPLRWTWFAGWSPDGRYLGFGYPRLVSVDVTTGKTRVILDGRGDAHTPVDAAWWP
jgi:hypothetical protein